MATQTEQRNKPAVRQQQPAEADQAKALEALEELANTYGLAALGEVQNRFERAVMLARGLEALKRAVGPLMPTIMKLQGSALGFRTDRDGKGGYDEETVRDCFIEATLRGFAPTGNEWNIIAHRCYGTKEGYAAVTKKLAGLTDLRLEPGVPKGHEGGAVVPYRVSWKYHGVAGSRTDNIPVRLNAGMGADGAIGKATRKALKRLYEQLTGSEQTDPDEDLPEQQPPAAAPAALPGRGLAPSAAQMEEIATLQGRLGIDASEAMPLQSRGEAEVTLRTLREKCRQEGLFPEDESPAIQRERL